MAWQCIDSKCPDVATPHEHETKCRHIGTDGMHIFGDGGGYKPLPDGTEDENHVDYQCNECGDWIAFV